MKDNKLLKYASYHLKNSFEGYGKNYRYNKFMYLLDKQLKLNKLDIELPYYWYNYGVVIHNGDYYSNLKESDINLEMSEINKSKILSAINDLKKLYKFKTTDEINDEIYNEAPFKFQKDFRSLLKLTNNWRNNEESNYSSDEISNLFSLCEQIIIDFPKNDFEELYNIF